MKYHKIQSVFKRDPATKNKRFLMGQWSCDEFAYLQNSLWVGTEKVDGTNIRLYKNGRIAGRTDNAQIHPGLMAHLESISRALCNSDLPESTVLYGEGYGAKIQSGGHYIPDGQSFVLFDAMVNDNYQSRSSVEDIASKLGIPVVPVLGLFTLNNWIQLIQDGTFANSLLHDGARNEGVVLRPEIELCNRTGDRIITKLKFRDFN